ncbi:MAG: carboxypeptidase-like regulatory domain-containing protein [Flavobacteriia bacterium]|nr:carboxypeptidase-like regulatory domain-containing protein [Flavobacteriia bacterium]
MLAQQTRISGRVTDAATGELLPYVRVQFQGSKIGTETDSVGNYVLESYYATDSIMVFMEGYRLVTLAIQKDQVQIMNVKLEVRVDEIEEVFIRPPDEFPSTTLHKKVIANKGINNKEKLGSYGYELYNKIQIDLNNIGDKFTERDLVKRLDLVLGYLDSVDGGETYLPVILSENISQFNFKNNPKKRKEVVSATRITGVENLQLNQFLGEMYLDFNIYDNYIVLFNKAFVSPVANFARTYYKFYLEDSTFIDNQWCYKLRFTPKRTGDMTFEGEMWIHDTTYAVKNIKASISPWANINYVQALYLEHHFDQVEKEVWMLTEEKMIIDLKVTKKTEVYGFYGRKYTSRRNFEINTAHPDEFYKSDNTVEFEEGAKTRDDAYWAAHRHIPLSDQEEGIDEMTDSLNNDPFFKFLKNATYMASTGYYPLGKIEIGSIHSLVAVNPVEKFRTGLAIRTSNAFSRRFEIGGKLYYGFGDERFKYGAVIRYNVTPKKRGLWTNYYNYDIEQLGLSPTAASVGSTFSSLLRTGPLDKLTFVSKVGSNFEKDVGKDVILFGGVEWKEYTALGLANYERYNTDGVLERISKVQTAEITARFRWAKDEEFIAGSFDRTSIRSKYPVFSLQGIFGVKGVFGSDYNYQKVEFSMEHIRTVGVLGRLRYQITAGYIFGTVAYPFLKVHEGSQSYWLYTNSFNRLSFFEFISDRYVGALVEQHCTQKNKAMTQIKRIIKLVLLYYRLVHYVILLGNFW